MEQVKSYKKRETDCISKNSHNNKEETPICINSRDKLTLKEVNKICNSRSEYFINNNSTLFTKIYLITILSTLLISIILFATYTK